MRPSVLDIQGILWGPGPQFRLLNVLWDPSGPNSHFLSNIYSIILKIFNGTMSQVLKPINIKLFLSQPTLLCWQRAV